MSIQGITEADIANFLAHNPGFFERNAELLASIQLTSPHGQRAVSLQERQMEMLRDRIKGLERRIMDMIRNSQENTAIADRLHEWTRSLMLVNDPIDLPGVLVEELSEQFLIPQAALRVWGVAPDYAEADFATGVSADMRSFASSLTLPYCGANSGFEVAQWMETPSAVSSMAMIPLRGILSVPAFGLLEAGDDGLHDVRGRRNTHRANPLRRGRAGAWKGRGACSGALNLRRVAMILRH